MLAKLLGAPVKTYVTRCALLELKELGANFAGALARPACLCCLSQNQAYRGFHVASVRLLPVTELNLQVLSDSQSACAACAKVAVSWLL